MRERREEVKRDINAWHQDRRVRERLRPGRIYRPVNVNVKFDASGHRYTTSTGTGTGTGASTGHK